MVPIFTERDSSTKAVVDFPDQIGLSGLYAAHLKATGERSDKLRYRRLQLKC